MGIGGVRGRKQKKEKQRDESMRGELRIKNGKDGKSPVQNGSFDFWSNPVFGRV